MTQDNVFYKIQNPKTGLFSTGGNEPTWSKVGKTWASKAHLNSHITGLSAKGRSTYLTAQAVMVECVTTVMTETPVTQLLDEAKQRRDDRENSRKGKDVQEIIRRIEALEQQRLDLEQVLAKNRS